jgi:hypothetical protein
MAGRPVTAGIYAEDPNGKQVYLHCWFSNRNIGRARLEVRYVGSGRAGRAQEIISRHDNPAHQHWLQQHWVGRTVLFAKPRRLERLDWLTDVLVEFKCAEGLVIFETPFLAQAQRVEARLIERYEAQQAMFNQLGGVKPPRRFNPAPTANALRNHVGEIRLKLANGAGVNELAREFGVHQTAISQLKHGKTYKTV